MVVSCVHERKLMLLCRGDCKEVDRLIALARMRKVYPSRSAAVCDVLRRFDHSIFF